MKKVMIAWTSTFSQHPIDQFMSAPFHAVGLLRESLVVAKRSVLLPNILLLQLIQFTGSQLSQ